MKLDVILLADYANIELHGKLNVMGIFTRINAKAFPVKHSEMYLVMKFYTSPAEFGQTKKLAVKLMDADGNLVVEWMRNFELPKNYAGRSDVNQVIRLADIVFPKPGMYQFSILIDNDEKGTYPIELNQISPSSVPKE